MQEIESSPPTDAEINLYARMEKKGWSDQRMAKVMRGIVLRRWSAPTLAAAE